MSSKEEKARDRGTARIALRRMLGIKPARTNEARPVVYTVERKCSTVRGGPNDGWPKVWTSVVIVRDGVIVNVTGIVGRALDMRHDTRVGGLVSIGGGSDAAFDIVNALSYALHGLNATFTGRTTPGAPAQGYTLRHEAL